MTERPSAAFACSLIGGIITLISALISINSWFFMYSNAGTTFAYSLWYFIGSIDFTAVEALVLFVVGVVCGVVIVLGAVLQYSGQGPKVKKGSIVVLIATLVGVPSTYFGMFLGGILSIMGAYVGLTWKPRDLTSPQS